MRITTVLSSLTILSICFHSPHAAEAQNAIGRYQMVTLPTKPGSFDSRVMILDTTDGDLWQWWESPAVGSSVPNTGITYLGKVAPGNAAGQTTPTRRSSPMEPLLPKH
jgi:hypothetical protein